MRWGAHALSVLVVAAATAGPVYAQRTEDNAVRAATDAFGVTVGNERIGVYFDRDVRGFSPVSAGNVRLEGLYFDMRGNIPTRLLAGTQIKVGLTTQGYAFPAPTGIVDYQFKQIPEKRLISTLVQAGPNQGYSYELDGYFPLDGKKLGVFAGGVVRREEPTPGQSVQPISVGALVRWKPKEDFSAMAFYGHFDRYGSLGGTTVTTSGPFLPPEIEAQRFSQNWSSSDLSGDSYGGTMRGVVNKNWTMNAGVFRYFQASSGSVSEIYRNVDQNGVAAQRIFRREPSENKMDSYSGESRMTGVFTGEKLRHTVNFSFKAREAMRTFGGSAEYDPGVPAVIGAGVPIPEPVWVYSAQGRDEVSQKTIGAAYQIAWRGIGEASVGVQQVDYEKIVYPAPGGPVTGPITTTAAPLLHNFTLALTPTEKLIVYASYTRGLEDANSAPTTASNYSDAPPAIRTEQRDFGVRYQLTPRVRLVAGYFDIQKPYFGTTGPGTPYVQLGLEKHAGYELSLSGQVTDQLNVVLGGVFMKPEVLGSAVDTGLIGEKPVGQPERVIRLNADYRLKSVPGLSVDAAINYTSEKPATSREYVELGGEQLMTEDYTTLDIGMRYRFKVFGDKPATLRAVVSNVTDEFAWQTSTAGSFSVSSPRAFQVSLAVDF